MTVAAGVSLLYSMSLTGRRFVSVKFPVSSWFASASTMPISTAPSVIQRGSPTKAAMLASVTPFSALDLSGKEGAAGEGHGNGQDDCGDEEAG
jgi:hypothetical protein